MKITAKVLNIIALVLAIAVPNILYAQNIYQKLDEQAVVIPNDASDWVIVLGKGLGESGLMWEVKNNYDGILNYNDPHDADNIYTWCDTNPETNNGNEGVCNENNTEEFIAQLNEDKFGGYSDWRMPTIAELRLLLETKTYPTTMPPNGIVNLYINTNYFPKTTSNMNWSSSNDIDSAEAINYLVYDYVLSAGKGSYNQLHVRAVRDTPLTPSYSLEPVTFGLFIGYCDAGVCGALDVVNIKNKFVAAGLLNESNTKLLTWNISEDDIISSLSAFNMSSSDQLIFYYSGHGTKSGGDGGEDVIPFIRDAEDESIVLGDPAERKFLTDDRLYLILRQYNNLQKLVILDSCWSYGFWGNNMESGGIDLNGLEKIGLIAAAPEFGKTGSDKITGEGLMSLTFSKGLDMENGFFVADINHDNSISIEEWHTHLRKDEWYLPWVGVQVREKEYGDLIDFSMEIVDIQEQKTENFDFEIKANQTFPWLLFLPAILNK